MLATEPTKPRRIELILRQIDSLPTLPVIATRLLSLTASEDSHAREVIELVSADPSLTAKVLSLCKAADRGIHEETLTVDRAVVLLGFSAIRNAVLSVKVFEMFPGSTAEQMQQDASTSPQVFDRVAFWSHSLAVGIMAELIAAAHPHDKDLPPDEAFVCGLLHDVGKLALDYVLPKSFARIVELTELNQNNIAENERKIVGIDHHTAGKRLAQQWRLPHRLQDCIWLHGSNFDTLPRLPHRRLVGLISLADLIARRQHVGYSGNHSFSQDIDQLAQKLGLDPQRVHHATSKLHEQLELRGKALGLHDTLSQDLYLESIQRANQTLGRLNQTLELRSKTAANQSRILDAIASFHASAMPGQNVEDAMESVIRSARSVFGSGFYAMLYPGDPYTGDRDAWLICQYGENGHMVRSQCVETPPHAPDLTQMDAHQPMDVNMMSILPWIADYLIDAQDMRDVKLLPMSCGWGTAAVLLHDRQTMANWKQLAPLASTWGAAIAGAAQHDGARRLGEQLAEANTALADAQDRLLRQESMARLGEMAAGAAHEMNNPLAVISGRSQLLSMTLDPGTKSQKAAQTIYQEAHRLSDLITALHMFADPPRPEKTQMDIARLLSEAIKQVQATLPRSERLEISLQLKNQLPSAAVDGPQIRQAIIDLLQNAVQANPKSSVRVVADVATGQRIAIQVIDDGDGMDEKTLSHAKDPFFSAKAAGRRVGMGLPRAEQIISGHSGTLEISSVPDKGTTVTVTLPMA